MTTSRLDLWFPGMDSHDPDVPVLLCLAGAGGGPSEFHEWRSLLRGRVEVAAVALPGRERRIVEPPDVPLASLVEQIVGAAEPLLSRPFALFGHSTGALVMYEVARALPVRSRDHLRHLFVGSQAAPRCPQVDAPYSAYSDEALIEYLRRLGGTPEEILRSRAFMRPYLRSLRADMLVAEQYEYPGVAGLGCPLTVFQGREDVEVNSELLSPWQKETTGPFRIVELPGGHFNLRTDRELMVEEITRSLSAPLSSTEVQP